MGLKLQLRYIRSNIRKLMSTAPHYNLTLVFELPNKSIECAGSIFIGESYISENIPRRTVFRNIKQVGILPLTWHNTHSKS